MKETLHGAQGKDETRVRRAFGWIVTFRDFPAGSYQTVDGDSMMTEALTLFTKGRAEFFLDGVKRGDRVPGILSAEHDIVGQGGTFEIRYTVPTTRLCVPSKINNGRLPTVKKLVLSKDQSVPVDGKYLVCLGSVEIAGKVIKEEQTFRTAEPRDLVTLEDAILLQLLD